MIRIALILLGLFVIAFNSSAEAGNPKYKKYKVYLNFWTIPSVEGSVEPVNLTDPLVLGTCLDGYLPIPGTELCGKDLKVMARRDPVWFPNSQTEEVSVRYEAVNSMIHPYIPLNWGQYEMETLSFDPHPVADPLGELEYRFTAVLKLKNFGDDVIEIIGRSGDNPFIVEAVEQPMTVNVEVVMEQRSQPRAQL